MEPMLLLVIGVEFTSLVEPTDDVDVVVANADLKGRDVA
jgi:hypothetical protein